MVFLEQIYIFVVNSAHISYIINILNNVFQSNIINRFHHIIIDIWNYSDINFIKNIYKYEISEYCTV